MVIWSPNQKEKNSEFIFDEFIFQILYVDTVKDQMYRAFYSGWCNRESIHHWETSQRKGKGLGFIKSDKQVDHQLIL